MIRVFNILKGASLCLVLVCGLAAAEKNSVLPTINWKSHNLVLQGENFLPVETAYSTPNITLFHIEASGYIPMSPMGPVNKNSSCYNNFFAEETTGSSSASAVASDAARQRPYAESGYVPGCPRDIGTFWASGAYVFDDSGNDLAGFDFNDDTRGFVIQAVAGERFIIFPEGGKGPKQDPAMKPMKLSGLFLRRHPDSTDTDDDIWKKMKIKQYVPGAPDLPVLSISSPIPVPDDAPADPEDSALDNDLLDTVTDKIEDVLNKAATGVGESGGGSNEVLIVIRGASPSDEDDVRKLAEALAEVDTKIKALLGDKAKVTTISLGNEIPFCNNPDPTCWSLNRSVSVFTAQ